MAEVQEELRNRMNPNHDDFGYAWQKMSNRQLINNAGAIFATGEAYNALLDDIHHMPDYKVGFLLQFENPLEVVRDQVLSTFQVSPEELQRRHIGNLLVDNEILEKYALQKDGTMTRDHPTAPQPEQLSQ